MATLTKWFDPQAASIKDPYEALRALKASRTPALIEVETKQAGSGNEPVFIQGLGYGPGEPDLSDEEKDAAEAYRKVEREILDRIAAQHVEEQRAAAGLLRG